MKAATAGSGAFILTLFLIVSSASGQLFDPAVPYGVGTNPIAIACSDYNNDGIKDLAVVNFGADNNVTVLLGNGDGTFTISGSWPVGSNPYSVTSSDFNNDGNNDLAVTNSASFEISILLGSGDGSFTVLSPFSAGSAPESIVSDDFNGDGNPDLAVANTVGEGKVSIYSGNGDGSFSSAGTYNVDERPFSIISNDFNGDGESDLAVANWFSSTVSILLGNGDCTFSSSNSFVTGNIPHSINSSDFNGDGNIDLAVANNGGNDISIHLGNGDGSFSSSTPFDAGSQPNAVICFEYNGDGVVDLAVANFGSDDVSVLLGNGDGTFASAISCGAGDGPSELTSGDFDGDGDYDIAVTNYYSHDISVLINRSVIAENINIDFGSWESIQVINTQGDHQNGFSPGETAVVTYTLQNNGDNVPTRTVIQLNLSTDHTATGVIYDSHLCGEDIIHDPLPSGTVSLQFTVSIPANALPGKYELLGSVRNRDDWDDVYEVTGCEINSGWDCQDMWISCLGVGDGIRTYKAVITGTDNHSRPYQFELITDDIDNLAATILESGPSHWFVENMFLVYPPMATQSAIEGAINNAAAGMDADDILMFQHTGHGNDSSDDYGGLFLQNSDYFSRAELYNFLDTNLPYGATCILAINVCNSGGWIEWLNTFDAHRITYYVLSSSEADEATSVTTWELGMDSTPFGYCLRKALAGYSDDNSDLDVDFNEIHSYVFDYMSNLPPYLLLIYKASHPMIYPSTASDYPVLIHQYGNMDILPWIEIQQPDADIQVVAGTDITISWYDNDSDDDATVNLYWGGTTIISGLTDSNGSLCTHDWETDGVSPGAYYIMGEIVDGEHEPCYSSSPGLVTILPPEPPVVITVSDSPDPLTRPEMLILSANVNAGTSAVNAVQFWRENNEIEGLQVTEVTDLFLGEDLSADGGWSLEIPTSNLSAGDYQYYAYAIDVNAQGSVVGSSALSTMNTIQNIPPQFESLSISDGSLEGGQEFTLIAHDLTDSDGQIVLAEFYFDIDKNSIFDPEQDTKLGDDENGADGWSWTGSLIDQPPGMLRFFAWIKDNDNGWSTPKSISANSTVVDVENTPLIFALGQNVPNPFNPSTTINFNLPYPAHVRIDVFSVDGKHVSTLLNRSKGAGHHVVQWLGQNDNGTPMASGVYFYRIQAGSYTETKRMVLVR